MLIKNQTPCNDSFHHKMNRISWMEYTWWIQENSTQKSTFPKVGSPHQYYFRVANNDQSTIWMQSSCSSTNIVPSSIISKSNPFHDQKGYRKRYISIQIRCDLFHHYSVNWRCIDFITVVVEENYHSTYQEWNIHTHKLMFRFILRNL